MDPIDGTRDFVRGIPLWAVLIGFEQDGEVVAGAAHCPGQKLLLSASNGGGTWQDGNRLHVSQITDPCQAVLCFNGFNKKGVSDRTGILPWVERFWAVRGLGGAVDAMLIALGKADVWVEPSAKPWDFAPLKILVEEAGGRFWRFRWIQLDLSGQWLRLHTGTGALRFRVLQAQWARLRAASRCRNSLALWAGRLTPCPSCACFSESSADGLTCQVCVLPFHLQFCWRLLH